LSFETPDRSTLYFSADNNQEIKLIMLTAGWQRMESETFTVSPQQSTLLVTVENDEISISAKDFRYPEKDSNENSYFVFLLIFFAVKLLISIAYIFAFRLPKQLFSIAAGIFLLSAFIDWTLPIHFLLRLASVIAFEFGLFFFTSRKIFPLLHNIVMTIAVNIAGFGLIMLAYLIYVFW
jgi:hypothetical protein